MKKKKLNEDVRKPLIETKDQISDVTEALLCALLDCDLEENDVLNMTNEYKAQRVFLGGDVTVVVTYDREEHSLNIYMR